MRLHMAFAGLAPIGAKPLRPYARAYAFRGLHALASLSMARSDRREHPLTCGVRNAATRAMTEGQLMQATTTTSDLPMPIWIALMLLGFFLFWPLGLIVLAFLIWSGKMMCCIGILASWRNDDLKRRQTWRRGSSSTGNAAFDEYRETTLRRLEEERREFAQFLERLRRARDQDESNRFMSEQADRRSPK